MSWASKCSSRRGGPADTDRGDTRFIREMSIGVIYSPVEDDGGLRVRALLIRGEWSSGKSLRRKCVKQLVLETRFRPFGLVFPFRQEYKCCDIVA